MAGKERYWANPVAARAAAKRYYDSHPKARADMLRRAIEDRFRRNFLVDLYKVMGCADCGEMDRDVLEFDHVWGKKMGNVSTMVGHSSWDALICEMNKCDIRCANCHARITLRRLHRTTVS